MRFVAPARSALTEQALGQPVFAGLALYADLLRAPAWPTLAELNAALQPLRHRVTGRELELSAQALLSDTEHYEERIFQRACIATRAGNWHDLFNALVWKLFPALKSALNTVQVDDLSRVGKHLRTRRQCACTQFDEAGAVAVVRDPALLALWDAHDWSGLFLRRRDAWSDGSIALVVFGHALFEHALNPDMLLVAKTVLVDDVDRRLDLDRIDEHVAAAIHTNACLSDPQQLRPLPMSGIPGWHRQLQDAAFYRELPCFRPLRVGRHYPRPLPA